MNGYDASRTAPADRGHPSGHGHGAGSHLQQQQPQYHTQWGGHPEGHGNGYVDEENQYTGYGSSQGQGLNLAPSSRLYTQPQRHYAGNWEDPRQQQHQQQQQYEQPRHIGGEQWSESNYAPSSSSGLSEGSSRAQRSAAGTSASNTSNISSYSAGQRQDLFAHYDLSLPSTSARQSNRPEHRLPSLPALTTSSNAPVSGFFQQLEGEIDHIQAKHTPISSPVSANLTPSTAGRSLDYSNASVQTGPRRLDSGSTVREDNYTDADPNAYGGSGIISMYDPRVPSPVLESGSQMSSQSPYLQHAPTSNLNLYGSYNQDGKSYGPQSASQSALSYASAPSSQPETARQRRPSGSGSLPRSASGAGLHYTPSMSAPWSPPVDSTQPLPASYMSSSRAGPSNGSMRSGRPSQDSNISCFSSNSRAPMSGSTSTSSGIVAPRPSMSSSIASRPSMNFSESSQSRVRPLPIPSSSAQNSGSSAQASAYMASPDIYESLPSIRERARSEFSRQSDFTQDFYASGEAIPANTSSRPPPSGRHPAADRYRITSTQQLEEHQYASTNRIHTAVPATSPSVRSVSEMSVNSTLHGFSPTLSHHTPTHPPPILHSHSEPVASHAISSTSSASRMQQNSNHALHTSTPRTPNSFASRSASFSTSAARERAEFARRNVSMGHGTVSRQAAGRPNVLSEPSPPLPSSPSISISTSYPDTSMSSTYSALSSAPSNSTYTSATRKQASMSPSNMSLSAQGFLSSKKRHDSERERRRIEGLGLQHLNPALLSNLAVAFKDRIPRTLNVKGSVHYPSSFTGEQAVSCLAEILPFPYTDDRRIAVVIARNLHRNMFFNEVDWDDTRQLRDSHEQVYCFQDDEEQATIDYLNGNVAGAGVYSPSARAHEAPNQAQEVPNGVITRFTKCYSPFCGMEGTSGSGACYSLYCPNGKNPLGLQRKKSSLSLASSATEDQGSAEAWASTAPADLIERLGPKEVARQNVIFEIVTGEQAYKKDLDMLETAYAEPLRSADPPIIEPRRLLQFANQVFANLDELRSHSTRLINAFQIRQREQNPVVESIGDLVLDAALEWGQAYMDFAEAQVTGEYLVHEEKSSNSAFATFLQSRREAFGIKQDFRHYHLRPTIRLQRYLLPLAEYVKRCPEGHPDIETTQEAMRIIRQQCDACNSAVAAAQLRLACMQYDKLIERDFNYANDLDLLHPTRQLFHHGKMYAKPEGARSEWTEYQIMLFDNYLVIAKPRRTAEGYRLLRKPVRLDMLNVSGWDDPPMIRSSGFHLSSVIRAGDRRDGSSNHSTSDRTESKMWPIAFRIYGRLSGTLTLFVETSKNDKDGQARREWKTKVEQAAAARKTIMDAAQVFDLKLLMDPDLRKPSSTASLGVTSLGKILTSCPFTGPTGQRLVAVGTSTGLYIALKRDPTSLRQILQISTQYCAILQDFGMFLVHTEGRLLSYLLETLVQTSSAEGKGQQGPQQVSGQKDILFFKVGRVGARTLVVYAKKDGVNSTVLKAMEPVANAERSRVQHSRFLGMGGKKTEWFRLFKDAAVPTEVYNLTFTRSKLALVCAPGFEILDIDTLKTGSFPDWASIKADPSKFDASMAMLQRRCYESRAIGLFRISDSEFLFCYEDFAFFADRHGDPVRARFRDMIEWEGRPDTVVYCAPYILAFDSRFIEVRDVSRRGKLVQIIRGSNIRCTYDGQGLPSSEMEIRMGGSVHFEERVPHIVMRENNVDRLYELVPRTA